MLTESSYYLATAASQGLLSKSGRIDVDGKWGTFTQGVYQSASPDLRVAVDKVIKSLTGGVAADLARFRVAQKALGKTDLSKAKGMSQDVAGIRAMISALAELEGVPASVALKIASLESGFIPNRTSPTGYKGLFQLGSLAMTDVYRFNPKGVRWEPAGSNKSGALFKMADPFNAEENTLVGLRYIKICARNMKVSLTDVVAIYMAFNIGLRGAKNVLAGNPELAAKEIKANPAYGKGNPSLYMAELTKKVNLA